MKPLGSDELSAALARLADADVAALLDDVRRDGAQLARRRLAEAYADALVRAVAASDQLATTAAPTAAPVPAPTPAPTPAPQPKPSGTVGCYVYAVVAGGGIGAGGV